MTIAEMRKSPLPPRAKEITFADRHSILVLNADAVLKAENIDRLAQDFYNDTFFSDQNACRSRNSPPSSNDCRLRKIYVFTRSALRGSRCRGAYEKRAPRFSPRGQTLINLKDRKTHLEIPLGQASFLFCRNHFNGTGCGRCFQMIVTCNRKNRPRTANGRTTAVVPIRSLQFVTDAAES